MVDRISILETISRRISIRTYEPEPMPVVELEAVRQFGETAEQLTSAEMRFYLCTHEDMGGQVKGIIGNYGKTIRAPHYLVLASRELDGYLTDAGFRFEQAILEATRRGLGTCWVGLMFSESSLRSFLGLDSSWRVIALTPIGTPADQSLVSRSLGLMARSATRKPIEQNFFWRRHGETLPPFLRADERMSRLFEATRRAPSWMNRQPWFFVLTGSEVLVYKTQHQDREGKDYHLLDCGIAMAHLHLAAKDLGMAEKWQLGRFEIPGKADAEPIGRYPLRVGA